MSGQGFPGGLGDMMGMIQKAQEEAERMKAKLEAELKQKTVEGSTGGGMVTVTATGDLEVRSIKIDPQAIDPEDPEMLEDLITAAVNVALKKAKELQAEAQAGELGNMLGGLGLGGPGGPGGMPDLGSLLGGLGG
ncbi:MAG: YbaB/EbfC family nucleoid-associated protein [Planctomycetota bacterium]|nr:MAG: YbaB/EbfC family nucleoid-associated protein [Planctomycetota bacterium]